MLESAVGAWLAAAGLDASGLGLDGLGLDGVGLDGVGLGVPGAVDGPRLACPGPDGLGLGLGVDGPGLAVALALAVRLGLATGLPQAAEPGPVRPGTVSCGPVTPASAALGLAAGLGLAIRAVPDAAGLAVRAGVAGLVLGAAALAGLELAAGPALAVGTGLAAGAARAGVCDTQPAAASPWPWPPGALPLPPGTPLPWPLAPATPVPAGAPPPAECRSAPVCDSICRPSGVSADTLIAMMNVTAATAAAVRAHVMRRPRGAAGRAVPQRPAGLATSRSHAGRNHSEAECIPPDMRLATAEHAAIAQATGSGCGVVRRARIRSRPSAEGSTEFAAERSARRSRSS